MESVYGNMGRVNVYKTIERITGLLYKEQGSESKRKNYKKNSLL